MSLVVSALLAIAVAGVPRPQPGAAARALAPAAIGGRLLLRDGDAVVTPRDARRTLRGKELTLHLRSGWKVVRARLDDDGFFAAEAEPGEWSIEYVSAGELVEFLDPPLTVRVRGGEVACAGVVEVAFGNLGVDLGQGRGRAAASDRCAELRPRLDALAAGRAIRSRPPSTAPLPSRRSAWELAALVRAGVGWRVGGPEEPGEEAEVLLSVTAIAGLDRPVGAARAVVLAASFTQADVPAGEGRRSVSAGVGYTLGSWVEVMVGPELFLAGSEGTGAAVFGQIRLGSEAFGLSARASRGGPGEVVSYGLDVAPLMLLGAFL
jgi:hypothetical protein